MKQKRVINKKKDNDERSNNIKKNQIISIAAAFAFAFVFCITLLIYNISITNDHSTEELYDDDFIESYATILEKYYNAEYTYEDYKKIALFKMMYEIDTICDISDEECLEEYANFYKENIENLYDIYAKDGDFYQAASSILEDKAEAKFTEWTNDDALGSYYVIKYFNIFITIFLLAINVIYFIFIKKHKNYQELSKNVIRFAIYSLAILILDFVLTNLNYLFFNHSINHICKYCSFGIGENILFSLNKFAIVKSYLNPSILLLIFITSIVINMLINLKKEK